jgi:hypothetical protein
MFVNTFLPKKFKILRFHAVFTKARLKPDRLVNTNIIIFRRIFYKMAPKLTSKNLQELSELLDSEDLAYKKCLFYSVQAQDPTLRSKLGAFANRHRQRYEALFDYLNSHE